jgi:hypothetical protein
MGFENLQSIEIIKTVATIGEIIVLAIMVIYVIFSFVLTRRIKVMNLNLKTPYSKGFITVSKIHTIALIVIVILTLLSIYI